LTYQKLNRLSNQLARKLKRLGAGRDCRVALVLDRSLEMIVAIIGVLKAGAAYLPIEPDAPEDRIRTILADSKPKAILTSGAYANKLRVNSGIAVDLDCYQAPWSEEDWNLDDLTTPEDLAYVIYTSGSTGRPKGVLATRGNLFYSTAARLQRYDNPVSRFLLLSSYAFDSSIVGIFWTLCSGGTLVLPPIEEARDPAALIDLMHDHAITHLLALPALYAALLEGAAGRAMPEWMVAIVAGQACPPELARNHYLLFPSVALYNEYGPTEAAVWSTVEHCTPDDDIVSIGAPVPGARAYLLDDDLSIAAYGSPSELFIGGMGVTRGYLNLPGLTAERFLPDPFSSAPGARMYRTGDRARFRTDGRLDYAGRVDWQIKIRGYRLEPEEIEAAIRSLPGIRNAVVSAYAQEGSDARLVGYVVAESQQVVSVEFIRAELSGLLPSYMVPSLFVFLDDLPVGPTGKLDRTRLPKPLDAKRPTSEYVAPRNEIDQVLAGIWSAVLGVPRVGIRDDFFALGGDSIMSIQIIARAKQAGIHFKPAQLFKARTIENLVDLAEPPSAAAAGSPLSHAIQTTGAPLPPDELEEFLDKLGGAAI
jgi:amino acid adenylation domain-containing protein